MPTDIPCSCCVTLRYVTLNVEDFVSESGQTDGQTASLLCWSGRVLLEAMVVVVVVDDGGCCYQRINRYRYFSSPPHTGYGKGGGKRALFNGIEWRVIMVML